MKISKLSVSMQARYVGGFGKLWKGVFATRYAVKTEAMVPIGRNVL